jgi:hypothetical protein
MPVGCVQSTRSDAPWCRFEVIVRDNDRDLSPSAGDYFSIRLSSTTALVSELVPETVFYTRAGQLGGGEIHVD